MVLFHAIMLDCGHHRIPALRLNLFAGASVAVVFGRHLRQQSIAESKGRTESGEFAAFQNFRIHRRSTMMISCAARADSGEFIAVVDALARSILASRRAECWVTKPFFALLGGLAAASLSAASAAAVLRCQSPPLRQRLKCVLQLVRRNV